MQGMRSEGQARSVEKHRVLIISYLFPPAGGIAVQRALSLAKYLPGCGYDVHVLSARNAAGPVRDPELLRQVPAGVTLHQAFTPEIPFGFRQWLWKILSKVGKGGPVKAATAGKRRFSVRWVVTDAVKRVFCPEPEVLWVPFALRQARRIIRRYGIETVLVTVPPFSALIAGTKLKREFPTITLVSDFRDEWLSFYLKDFDFQSGDYTRRRAEAIERETVERSDLVVAVTDTSLREIRERYPDQPDCKFACVHNGYDPEVFADFRCRRHGQPGMIVTHVGTAYKTASPRYYLDALDAMPEEFRSQMETRFIGRVSEGERALLDSRKSLVRVLGFMPQQQALQQIEETDFLLLTMTNEISLPGKLFEYLATGKPILAIAPRGSEVERILRETGGGWCAEPDDRAGIQAMLHWAFHSARSGTDWFRGDREAIRRYERPMLAAEYARLIEARRAFSGPRSAVSSLA
jgi:glycosyltransferase involved in cell wall biosynthesis